VTATAFAGTLEGLRVLDLGTMIAGPFCCALMADHGADVIKIERPNVGDPMRSWTPMVDGQSLWWKVSARNKRLITLDLGSHRGQEVLKKLVSTADVIVENFRPGTLERWNLGYPMLEEIRPGIILARVSGYGQTGPYATRPGYGTIAEAMSGIPAFTGFPDQAPQLSAFPLADTVAGVFAAFGVMSALYHRSQTGRGQVVDVSLFEPLFRLVESQVIAFDQLGLVKQRVGNRIEEDAPRNAYATSDGKFVTISASSPRTWERFANAIGHPELISDPRFIDNAARCANVEALDEVVAAWHRTRTLDEIMAIFDAQDVVAGPIYDLEQIFADAQYKARDAIVKVVDPTLGEVRMPGVTPRFTVTPGAVRHPGMSLGASNDDVYLGELALDRDEYQALCADGVI
jgi:crotonobetainyl-CoA:carnitine CoA-transferase CaiB-like acyl-CoA transferase